MTSLGRTLAKSALTSVLVFGAISASAWAGDLSRYRAFQFGSNLATVAEQAGVSPSDAKVVHSHPALIQKLSWRPQALGWSSTTEPAQEVAFTFYDGELFQIAVNYDWYETEGLTAADIVAAISATYGIAEKPPAMADAGQSPNRDGEDVLALWQDPQYRFDLIRASYGTGFKLIGVLKKLEAPFLAASLEATRLDIEEAPQRDAARTASEKAAAAAKLEKARLVNMPNFRP
jgi:hypothetical protein